MTFGPDVNLILLNDFRVSFVARQDFRFIRLLRR